MSSYTCERKYDIEEDAVPPHAAHQKERHDTRRHKHHHSELHHHREHRHRHKQPQMDIDEMEPSPLKAQIGRGRGLSTVDDTIKNDDVSLREEAEQGRKLSHDTIQPFSEANESEIKKKEVELWMMRRSSRSPHQNRLMVNRKIWTNSYQPFLSILNKIDVRLKITLNTRWKKDLRKNVPSEKDN
jgi:hypothetical protein